MRIFIALFAFCALCFASEEVDESEFAYKIIIKIAEPEPFELIDLNQTGINTLLNEAVYDSSKELKKNNKYLQYEDTDKDFALLVGYNKNLHLEFENLSINGDEFVEKIFEKFIDLANSDKSVQLLNHQHNSLYESAENFALLDKKKDYEQFGVSPLLDFETSFERLYLKAPDYMLFIAFDNSVLQDKKWWFFTKELMFVNLRYKIINLKTNKLVKMGPIELSFGLPKTKDMSEKYNFAAEKTGLELKKHLAKVVKELE